MTIFRQYAAEPTTPYDRVVYFDMDGTVADLYAVDGWLEMLEAGDATPYAAAEPMIDYALLCDFADDAHRIGWDIGVVSWLAKDADDAFDRRVIEAKLEWLDAFFPVADEIIICDHGLPKYEIVSPREAILIDDEATNRMHWDASGPLRRSYPASELDALIGLLDDSLSYLEPGSPADAGFHADCTAEELAALVETEVLGDSPDAPVLKVIEDGGCYIVFANREGTSYFEDYVEAVRVEDPFCVSWGEKLRVVAKARRIAYDTA